MLKRGNRHQVTIDGQTIWVDSNTEEYSLRRFIDQYGFSGKWYRPYGVKHRGTVYTADFELMIALKEGLYSPALVEVKEYRKDMTLRMAQRMYIIANHYSTNYCYLYAYKSDRWYRVSKNGVITACEAPTPTTMHTNSRHRPKALITRRNYFGRRYKQSFGDLVVEGLFGSGKKYKGRR